MPKQIIMKKTNNSSQKRTRQPKKSTGKTSRSEQSSVGSRQSAVGSDSNRKQSSVDKKKSDKNEVRNFGESKYRKRSEEEFFKKKTEERFEKKSPRKKDFDPEKKRSNFSRNTSDKTNSRDNRIHRPENKRISFKDDNHNEAKPFSKKRFQSNTEIKLERRKFEKSVPHREPLKKAAHSPVPKGEKTMRLNKYLANSGVAARRKCDDYIAQGHVKVNNDVVTEMGYRVKEGDKVYFKNKLVQPVNYVYILLNKPKDYITTADDERGRSTVLELVQHATEERVYPVGRLDRNTTGLLLLTNDGDLAQKLSHPSYGAQKLYEVELDKPLSPHDLQSIENGIELEDGLAVVDGIDYAHRTDKAIIGISIHIGKNRIVRRIFEHLGYKVMRLDRTLYAGLTKKDLPRGKWRMLTEREIIKLKYLK